MTASTALRRTKSEPESAPPAPRGSGGPWYRSTWALALASSVALWLPLSPLNLSLLAWVAPLGWLLLVREERMSGWRPYVVLWLAGFAHWLLVMEGVRLAYWALYFGWIALAAYLGAYLPLFVGLSRVAVHRLRVPLVLAAPLVWVGLELVRGYAITGFSLALLGHTQVTLTPLLQVADLGGAYAVSFVVMLVAAAIAQALPWNGARMNWKPLPVAVAVVALALGYGQWRLNQTPVDQRAPLRVTLVQNAVDTIFDVPPEHYEKTFRLYLRQAIDAAKAHPDTDVMIWPESVFMSLYPEWIADRDAAPRPEWNVPADEFARSLAERRESFQYHALATTAAINGLQAEADERRKIAQVVGTLTLHARKGDVDHYNSALLLSPDGEVVERYHKQHLVMFGEYIPLGSVFPWIYRLTPMSEGLSRGSEAKVFSVAGYRLSPSICFESTVPHFIRRQARELAARGESPDYFVNVTNDGWFWGSGVLDLHFNCAVMRAVEHRRPMLVASNTGLSVAVDGSGRILAKGPRRQAETIHVAVPPDGRTSFYTQYGDLFAGACFLFCAVCAVRPFVRR